MADAPSFCITMEAVRTSASRAGAADSTHVPWLVCLVAGVGFVFDIYEIVVQPIVLRPVLMDLGGLTPGTSEFNRWAGWFLFVPAMSGGIFGLLGGYLTDRFGRQRVLVFSIVLYGIAAFSAGFATSLGELLIWRCVALIGVCVEFVAAIAWLAELFSELKRREAALAMTQAMSALGGFLVAAAYYLAVTYGEHLPAIHGSHAAWRYTLMFGAVPAIPMMILRPFLPESPLWHARKAAGTLQRPSLRELFQPALRRTTLVSTLLATCTFALAPAALQHIPRIVPTLPDVAILARAQQEQMVSLVHVFTDLGQLAGRLAFAVVAVLVVRRRAVLRGFQIPALLAYPLVLLLTLGDLQLFAAGAFLLSALACAQLSFWGNYLPRVYPTHLRGTGESFAANVGGRIFGTSAALATTQLSNVMPGSTPGIKLAAAAAVVAATVSLIGLIASSRLPEPPHRGLEE